MSYKIAESYNMSTVTQQMISEENNSDKAAYITEEVKEYLEYIEKKMSFYLKDSDVSKINDNIESEIDSLCVLSDEGGSERYNKHLKKKLKNEKRLLDVQCQIKKLEI